MSIRGTYTFKIKSKFYCKILDFLKLSIQYFALQDTQFMIKVNISTYTFFLTPFFPPFERPLFLPTAIVISTFEKKKCQQTINDICIHRTSVNDLCSRQRYKRTTECNIILGKFYKLKQKCQKRKFFQL